MEDRIYMQRAIELARRGTGWVSPNPLVGAVIVKDGRVIGEGWHHKYGDLHAERDALANLTEPAEGAVIYVTLEPCCHYGKQPPCTLAIIEHGISRVVVGSRDPNPKVAGGGVRMLREHGVEVIEDFMREECDALNPIFFHYITTGRPYVKMKYAMTADGKIATKTGASKWITGEAARTRVHEWRHACMGIMAGIGTVLADDPQLNCRIENGRDPVRIICDTHLRIPLDSQICRSAAQQKTIVACGLPDLPEGAITEDVAAACGAQSAGVEAAVQEQNVEAVVRGHNANVPACDNPAAYMSLSPQLSEKLVHLLNSDVQVVNFPDDRGSVSLSKLMGYLGDQGVDSILLEGGATLNEAALRERIVREIDVFVAPKIFGGQAKSPVAGFGVAVPDEALKMKISSVEPIGDDILLTYTVPM